MEIIVGGMTHTRHVVDGEIWWTYPWVDRHPNKWIRTTPRLCKLTQVTLVDALNMIAALMDDRSTTAVL